ncbi:MAG: hypothetical protein J5531_07115 [Lachnospiraceae bacterium]|nr:hypothetical protein [Lachnospiraceae bacterium]
MKKRIWLPLVFLCLVAFAGIALADTKQSSLNGMKVESSYNLEKDGSAAYASLWTSQNVYSWSISVTAYAVDPLTGEVRKTARTEKGEDGNGTAFAVRAAGGEFLYQVNYRDEVQTVDQDGRPAGKLTCNDKTVWKWTMPEKVPTPTVAPTAAPTNTPIVTATPSPTPVVYPVSNHITWATHFASFRPDNEDQLAINKKLYELGLDCAIDFVPMETYSGEETKFWLKKMKNAGTVPDILNTGIWDNFGEVPGIVESTAYIKENLLPLNDYLATQEGAKLYDCFPEMQWKGAEIAGVNYTIPTHYSRGYFLWVKDEYANRFANFDGTYDSLLKIRDSIGNPELQIVISGIDNKLASAMLGYSSYLQYSYDTKTHQLIPFGGYEDGVKIWNRLFRDVTDGTILDRYTTASAANIKEDKILAEVVSEWKNPPKGYTVIRLSSDAYSPSFSGQLGVYKDSQQKELALRVLTVCMSDPEIVEMLRAHYWKAQSYTEEIALRKQEKAPELAGFIPNLTDAQWKLFYDTSKQFDTSQQYGLLYTHANSGVTKLAKDFNAAKVFGQLAGKEREELMAEINRQIAEFLAAKQ